MIKGSISKFSHLSVGLEFKITSASHPEVEYLLFYFIFSFRNRFFFLVCTCYDEALGPFWQARIRLGFGLKVRT